MMTTTSLTSRVTTRLPFQTLAAPANEVDEVIIEATEADEPASMPLASDTGEACAQGWPTTTTLLLIAENTVRVLQPLAIGLAINGLLTRSSYGVILLIGQHLSFLVLNRLRQMSVTRQINDVTDRDVQRMTSAQPVVRDTAEPTEESQLRHRRIELLGDTLPQTVHIASTLCGALVLLAWYDWMLVPLCLLLVAPALLLNTACGRRLQLLGRQLAQDEKLEIDIVSTGDTKAIQQHFDRQNQVRLQLVNAETSSFFLMQLFVLGALVMSLVHICWNTSAQPGHIIAVLLYVLWYATALSELPVMLRNVSHIWGDKTNAQVADM